MGNTSRHYFAFPPLLRQIGVAAAILAAEAGLVTLIWFFFQPSRADIGAHSTFFFMLAILLPLIPAVGPYVFVVARRYVAYQPLFLEMQKAIDRERSDTAANDLLRSLIGLQAGREVIQPVGVLRQDSSLRIVLPNPPALQIGTQLLCFRLSTAEPLGVFNVLATDSGRILASEVRINDALWWGAVRQEADQGRLGPPADTAVLVINSREAAND